jgi:subtilase-type serine protease
VPGAPSTAYADISDQQFLGSLEAGYALPLRKATLTPFAGMNFGVVNQNGFTEHGAGVLDLSVHGQSEGSAQSALGARLSDVVPVGGINLALDAGLGWTHEFASTERSAIESFTGGPGGSFTVVGASVPRDAALVSFGVATSVATNTSLYLTYQGQFGDGYSNAATGGLRFTW